MENSISHEKALKELEKGYEKAETVLQDEDKLERLLQRLEKSSKRFLKSVINYRIFLYSLHL